MDLSILILCIISMTSFNLVTSSSSSQLHSNSTPLADFGYSQLIDNLVLARDEGSTYKAFFAIWHKIEEKTKLHEISAQLSIDINTDDATLDRYITSSHNITSLYNRFDAFFKLEIFPGDSVSIFESYLEDCISSSLNATSQNFRLKDKSTGKNYMDTLIEFMNIKEKTGSCSSAIQSPQYKVSALYHSLVILAVKAYAMRIYGYKLLRKNVDEYSEHIKNVRKEYEMTVRDFQKSAVSAIAHTPWEIHSCDSLHQEGKYIELKWLFNPFIINEAYLNENSVRCWNTCPDYKNTTFHQYSEEPLEVNPCPARIYDCFRETLDVCEKTENYVKSQGSGPLDSVEVMEWCLSKRYVPSVSNGFFDRCDQCICYCSEPDHGDIIRTFSTRAVESDASKNKVITGVQFVERNRVIHLRIQEGELKPNGTIEESTVEWQPVNEIDWKSPFITEYDIFTITHDQKYVNLDTLVASTGRVLTGIRLHAQGSHLALKIRSHAFNYSTGILQSDFWQSYSPIPRQETTMTDPDTPLSMDQSVIDTRKNTYVAFRKTDYGKNAAQTTVPFIDALPVTPYPPVPLSGAGLYYRGQTGYGGFIGLKAIAYYFPGIIDN